MNPTCEPTPEPTHAARRVANATGISYPTHPNLQCITQTHHIGLRKTAMDTPPNAPDNESGNEPSSPSPNRPSGSSPERPSERPSNGPAPDSPFDTSPSEGFEGPFPPTGGQPGGPAGPSAGGDPFGAPPMSVGDDWSTLTIPASIAVDMARDWVRERQTATLLGTFAVGVFVGVLSR